MSDLISITGHLCNDYIITVEEYPPVGESRRITRRENYFGGGAANIAVGIAKLGGNAELITAVGKDFPNSEYERYLKNLPIKTTYFTSKNNCSTAFMVNTTKGDQITYFDPGASEEFVDVEAPKRDFIHMATGEPEYNRKVARNASFASFDPGQDVVYYSKEQLEDIINNIDILICNNFELDIVSKTMGCTQNEIMQSVPLAILTHGKEGSNLYIDNKITKIPACRVEAVDPTGAGDAYRAGLFAAMKRGHDYETSCRVGAVVSSFAVEKIGTQTNLPTWSEMKKRFDAIFKERIEE